MAFDKYSSEYSWTSLALITFVKLTLVHYLESHGQIVKVFTLLRVLGWLYRRLELL